MFPTAEVHSPCGQVDIGKCLPLGYVGNSFIECGLSMFVALMILDSMGWEILVHKEGIPSSGNKDMVL